MNLFLLLAAVLALAGIGYRLGRGRALAVAGGRRRDLNSLPGYYGLYTAIWCAVPAIAVLAAWLLVQPIVLEQLARSTLPAGSAALTPAMRDLLLSDIRQLAAGDFTTRQVTPELRAAADAYAGMKSTGFAAMAVLALIAGAAGLSRGWQAVNAELRARNLVERVVKILLFAASAVAVLTTIGIVLSLLFEAIRFFNRVSPFEFLFGLQWSPQTALRADQVGASGSFGAVPIFAGTALISVIAMCVAVPLGLMSAIYMAEYASPRVRALAKPALEILAGVPTVVYGFFAALTIGPLIRDSGGLFGLDVASESALAAGLVMGVMIIPFVSSLSDDVISAVPQSLRDGSYAIGATKSETIRQVVLPAALPGIVGSVLLAASRAIGETMIVVMAAGLAANLTANPLEAVTTVTVQIVTLLVGDQEFDSAKTLAAFALGLVLFVVTLCLNIIALVVVRRYREKYD